MILDVLVFTLGFLTAGVLALATLPAVWRRALRLSGERLSRLVPLSAEEIAAERDHLRAAHAVELRRAEQRLERAEANRTALRVEAARREGRILTLDGEAASAQVRIASLEAEVAQDRRRIDGLQAQTGAEAMALHGLSTLAENRLLTIAALQSERSALQSERSALQSERATLQGERSALDNELTAVRGVAEDLRVRCAALHDDGERLGREHAALRIERDTLAGDVDRGRGTVAGLETKLIGVDTRNDGLRRELEESRRAVTAAAERIAADAGPRSSGILDGLHLRQAGPGHDVENLMAELAFMTEQATSAERRATEASLACEALRAELTLSRNASAPPEATSARSESA